MSLKSLHFTDSMHSSVSVGDRDTDTNPRRASERFTVTTSLLTSQDRNNPNLLKSILYEENIKRITSRVCFPTVSSVKKNEIIHPQRRGHDVTEMDLWYNMAYFDNHVVKRLHDGRGNNRIFSRGYTSPLTSVALGRGCVRPPPLATGRQCKEINHQQFAYPENFSYRHQWRTNQTIHQLDFMRPKYHCPHTDTK